ncbi:MAG: hypothetical protein SPE99_01905 [Blautia sp.]|nr:hypothetical protein [Blautia sp.]
MPEAKQKKMIINTAYTMGGALLMNGILQLVIYPLLNRFMGSDQLGRLLYIMGLAAILCPSVGQALNNSRLVVRRDHPVKNGDYNRILLLFGALGCAAAVVIAADSIVSPGEGILAVVLLMLTIFRYYGDVEYRLNLNYRKYFIYYAVLSVGYVLGFGAYLLTGNWYLIFLMGEGLALIYLAVTGTVFREFWKAGSCFSIALKRGGMLVFSYLITNLTLNIDRVALKFFIGDLAVTYYYVTSLIGKTMVLLVAPVNTIIISYLTKQKERLGKKQFLIFVGAGGLVSFVFFLAAQVATPLFIRLFYSDLYNSVKDMITVVNLSQVLGLFSAYLFVVILTFAEEKWQLILQIFHLITVTVLVLIFTRSHGIMGFAAAVLGANIIRVAAVIILGLLRAGGAGRKTGKE